MKKAACLLSILIIISLTACSSSKKAYKEAKKLADAGLYVEAAEQDLKALREKPDFKEALIHLREVAPKAYYELSKTRVVDHTEPLDKMMKHGVLIDGEGVVDGGETRILLQIFSKTVVGPIFFEFIQRKGDDGFGEGNFRALFESIERDQIERGVLSVG